MEIIFYYIDSFKDHTLMRKILLENIKTKK